MLRLACLCILIGGLFTTQPLLASPDYEEGLRDLSRKLSAEASKRKFQRLAVADFTDLEGSVTPLGRFLAEEITASLAETGTVAVIERARLNVVLKAERLPSLSALDPATLKQIGKRVGADAFVTASLTESADGVRMTAKLVSAATASVVAAVKITLPQTGALAELGKAARPRTDPIQPTPLQAPPRKLSDTMPPSDMALVPAGAFLFGEKDKEQKVFLPAFWIDVFEVTNEDYAKVRGIEYPPNRTHHPVADMSWKDAVLYCEAQGKRLPTEQEWEKAARGADGRSFPWGNDYDPQKLNAENRIGDTSPVGQFPQGASPYGLFDMAGNAAEWTSSGDELTKVYKGGAWVSPVADVRSAARKQLTVPFHLLYLGLRCAKDGPR